MGGLAATVCPTQQERCRASPSTAPRFPNLSCLGNACVPLLLSIMNLISYRIAQHRKCQHKPIFWLYATQVESIGSLLTASLTKKSKKLFGLVWERKIEEKLDHFLTKSKPDFLDVSLDRIEEVLHFPASWITEIGSTRIIEIFSHARY